MPSIDPIETERLRIRELTPTDREALLTFVRDPSQIEHMMLVLDTEQALDGFLAMAIEAQGHAQRLDWHLAVEDLETGRLVGNCCLMLDGEWPGSAELGYWFMRGAWGRGYATEASRVMLRLGFDRLKLHRVWGKCHVANEASAKVLTKLGMKYEGTLREHAWLRDHYRSSHLFGLLEAEDRANG